MPTSARRARAIAHSIERTQHGQEPPAEASSRAAAVGTTTRARRPPHDAATRRRRHGGGARAREHRQPASSRLGLGSARQTRPRGRGPPRRADRRVETAARREPPEQVRARSTRGAGALRNALGTCAEWLHPQSSRKASRASDVDEGRASRRRGERRRPGWAFRDAREVAIVGGASTSEAAPAAPRASPRSPARRHHPEQRAREPVTSSRRARGRTHGTSRTEGGARGGAHIEVCGEASDGSEAWRSSSG